MSSVTKITQREGTNEATTDSAEKQATGAIKYDAGKPGVYQGCIKRFPRALMGVARVSTFGKNKYGTWDGWESVDDGFNRYMNAGARHMLAAASGEEVDPDSKTLLHLEQVAWNALATLELYLREKEKNGTDA